ncbi:YceD family protein [Trichlorobacter ammonificans]|uniref:DUF177 domain-containing protein n=1 Tax=Trichlorobacter ammonificans TaxID=2916410 RepID=A0ABM9D728_9BACT|nr:DUF177 domain-containing protein [Trichlorobacter ammonificans]CAH2030994.1 conserved protein of unknown function [Trichlorobacter ammonificans]
MKVKTEHIRETVRQFVFQEAAAAFPMLAEMEEAGECRFTGPVSVELTAGREMDHYRVEGTLSVPLSLTCSRCLAEFGQVVSSQFTIFFREGRGEEQAEEHEVELAERDLVSAIFQGDEIDLLPEIGEQVALTVPLKPLCSESCKGLCPSCGVDRNTTVCTCSQEPKLSKFSALKDFKVR